MLAKLGDRLECDFGQGVLIACTKDWAILKQDNGTEIAVYLKENWIAFPAEVKGDDQSAEPGIEIPNE